MRDNWLNEYDFNYPGIGWMVGKTVTKIEAGGGEPTFFFDDGTKARLIHHQDCCEHVYLEDQEGDWDLLLNTPILVAEEVSNADRPAADPDDEKYGGSYTWTFYKFATIHGYVDLRYYGTSNGYYSESMDFEVML